jgi:hypothetical protein
MSRVQMQLVGANLMAQMAGDCELPGKMNYLIGDKSQWRGGIPTFAKVRVAEIYRGIDLVYYGNGRELEYDFTVAPGANPNAIQFHFNGTDKISVNANSELILRVGKNEIVQHKPEIYQIAGGIRQEVVGGYKLLDKNTVTFSVGQYDRNLPLVIDPVLSYSSYFGGNSADAAWSVAVSPVDGSVYIAGETLSSKLNKNGGTFSTSNAFQTVFAGGQLTGDAFVAKFDSTLTNLLYCTYVGGKAEDGAFGIAVDASGNAFITGFTTSTNFPTTPDALYKKISGKRDSHTSFFPVDAYVSVLDPNGSNLLYSTYLGGTAEDAGTGIALDSSGNIYVTGLTASRNFPTTNALAGLNHLVGTNNAFVTEISSNGSALVFSSYLGGRKTDEGESIAVDGSGYIYVAGFTSSSNFPTVNPIQPQLNRGVKKSNVSNVRGVVDSDAFVAKLNPAGAGLVYSTFLGGTNKDMAFGIAIDSGGNAYVTGSSASPDFWNTNTLTAMSGTNTIPGLRSQFAKGKNSVAASDVFLAKLDPTGALVYSAIFGGSTNDFGYDVALDSSGDVFVTGATASTNFPVLIPTNTVNFTSPSKKERRGYDAFVTAVKSDASGLLYSVYVGGKKNDYGYGIAVDAAANVYIVGNTLATNFPSVNAFQPEHSGTNDAFLIKIEP